MTYDRRKRLETDDGAWRREANCQGVNAELFYTERGESTYSAKQICRGCVVREECLEYALANGEKFGIWGGMSERERRRIRRTRSGNRMLGPKVSDVVDIVAELTGFDTDDLKGPERQRHVTDARHIACWVAYRCGYGASFPLVGYVLHRDHSTVMSAVQRVNRTPALLEMAELIAEDVRARFHRTRQLALDAQGAFSL